MAVLATVSGSSGTLLWGQGLQRVEDWPSPAVVRPVAAGPATIRQHSPLLTSRGDLDFHGHQDVELLPYGLVQLRTGRAFHSDDEGDG